MTEESRPETGGAVVIRMPKTDHSRFVELIHETSSEFFDNAEAKDFRALVAKYFPKGA